MKKILIVTSEFGSGHKTPAEALRQEFIRQGHHAEFFDFEDIIGAFTERVTKELFDFATTHVPLLHRGLAAATNSNSILDVIIRLTPAKVSENLEARIRSMQPDAVVTTFPAANRLIAELKKKYPFELVSVVTDLKTIHHYWIAEGTDAYIAALPDTATSLAALGVPKEKIFVLGYPLRAPFFAQKDTHALRAQFAIANNDFVALYLVHTAPDSFAEQLARALDTTPDITPVIICGKNEALKQSLKRELRRTHIIGFANNMDEYLRVADVAIGKAGTGFLMEAAAMGCPVIITKYLKPQEEGNAEFFESHGIGFIERTAAKAMARVRTLKNESKDVRAARSQKTKNIFPKNTTAAIVEFITQDK